MQNFTLHDQVPAELVNIIPDYNWDMKKLHELKLPIKLMSIEKLEWQLELPWWRHKGIPFQVSPRQVINNPKDYPEQYMRTLAADLNFPVIVREIDNRFLIMDGVHRLLKAILNNSKNVSIAIFEDKFVPLIITK